MSLLNARQIADFGQASKRDRDRVLKQCQRCPLFVKDNRAKYCVSCSDDLRSERHRERMRKKYAEAKQKKARSQI